MSTRCPAPNCGKEFEFDWSETQVHEVPLELFERRHFYRSELQEAGTQHRRRSHHYIPDLSLSISRQKLLRTAATETPNS